MADQLSLFAARPTVPPRSRILDETATVAPFAGGWAWWLYVPAEARGWAPSSREAWAEVDGRKVGRKAA